MVAEEIKRYVVPSLSKERVRISVSAQLPRPSFRFLSLLGSSSFLPRLHPSTPPLVVSPKSHATAVIKLVSTAEAQQRPTPLPFPHTTSRRRAEDAREAASARPAGRSWSAAAAGMAGRVLRSCVQTALKMVNAVLGIAGMAVILYALWMLRAWSRQVAELHQRLPVPWFIYTCLALGIFLCLLTCSGHVAAETANGHCLSCYMIFIFLLVVLEGAVTTDVFLNSNWEEDFPDDPSGKFAEFKDFVSSNFEICEWVGLSLVAAQVLSIILAMVLRALGPDRESDYDSDDDTTVPARLPLLRNQAQDAPSYVEPNLPRRSDSWSVRILDKANK